MENNNNAAEMFYHFNADNRIVVFYAATIDEARRNARDWNKLYNGDARLTITLIGNAVRPVECTRLTAVG
jgi:hypothetical protein